MAFDVVALFLLIPKVSSKLLLAIWTAFLHMLFPLIGFQFGEWLTLFLADWANLLSSILLFCVGLQFLLSSRNKDFPSIPLPILAIAASLDTFSVSLSFGMLNLQKNLFILSAGIGTFLLSYSALLIAERTQAIQGYIFKWIAGLTLITISLLTL